MIDLFMYGWLLGIAGMAASKFIKEEKKQTSEDIFKYSLLLFLVCFVAFVAL